MSMNEAARLSALRAYDILDTPAEADFDALARIASDICQTPVAAINFIDNQRQWFKSEIGLGLREMPMAPSSNGLALLQAGLMIVPDTLVDRRFAGNPLVNREPYLRFYAGALLETDDKQPLGTLCVMDYQPRQLTDAQQYALGALARQVMAQLELRRALREKARILAEKDLLVREVNHRVNNSLQLLSSLIRLQRRDVVDPVAARQIDDIAARIQALAKLHALLYRPEHHARFEFGQYLQDVCDGLTASTDIECDIEGGDIELPMGVAVPLALIVNELITNTGKHARPAIGKPRVKIASTLSASGQFRLTLSDNGQGLPQGFDAATSEGLGMRVVAVLVEQLGGTFTVGPGPGARFFIDIQMPIKAVAQAA